ncbi:hypothetical protein MMC22_004616 [Lobaria immixta]|nr:hypothetical protein [Lobaria immixta]
MSVYQQARFDQAFSVWIIIHVSASMQEKFSANVPINEEGLDACVMLEIKTLMGHMAIISTAVVNWGSYVDSLSEAFAHRNDRAQMSKIVKIDASEDDDSFEANLQDMQWLQWLAQRLLQLRGHLRDNLTTLAAVRKLGDRFPAAAEPANRQSQDARARVRDAFGDWMTVWTHALAQHLRDTEMLISQSQGCAELVYNILKSKETEIVQTNGALLNGMTERTRADSLFLMDLSIKSHRAARSMRTITFLTLIYVPPSFLATFFGMNLLQVTPSSSTTTTASSTNMTAGSSQRPRLLFAPQLWMYAATAVPLTALTFALWWVWDRRAEREERGVARCS